MERPRRSRAVDLPTVLRSRERRPRGPRLRQVRRRRRGLDQDARATTLRASTFAPLRRECAPSPGRAASGKARLPRRGLTGRSRVSWRARTWNLPVARRHRRCRGFEGDGWSISRPLGRTSRRQRCRRTPSVGRFRAAGSPRARVAAALRTSHFSFNVVGRPLRCVSGEGYETSRCNFSRTWTLFARVAAAGASADVSRASRGWTVAETLEKTVDEVLAHCKSDPR